MENNYFTFNTTPPPTGQAPAILILDIRNFIDILKPQSIKQARLTDSTYNSQENLDYLLAISG